MKVKQKYTSFTVDISDLSLFRDGNNKIKSMEDLCPILRKIIFAMSRSMCAWSIQRFRMAGNELTLNGHCLEDKCDGKLFAYTECNQILLSINITLGNQSILHEKKKQIRGQEKNEIMEMLKNNKAMVVTAKIAKECLRVGDIEPPFLPHNDTIRKIRSAKQKYMTFNDDPVILLREMKYTEPYQNSIGNIGLDPFDVSFCTPHQQVLKRIATNRKKIIISFDASGVPVKVPKTASFSLERNQFKPIYLYVIMLQISPGENVPVYQFLT